MEIAPECLEEVLEIEGLALPPHLLDHELAHFFALPAAGAKSPAASEWHEAAFYDAMGQGTVQCTLCPWQCVVPAGKPGRCRVRVNRDGKLYTLVYGRPVAMHNDPIEKKPFFHVYPGSRSFSIATVGCNMVCTFCQNWEISQADPHETVPPFVPPGDIVTRATAKRSKRPERSPVSSP